MAVVRTSSYAPAEAAAGHDGLPPEFAPARGIQTRDKMTGKIVREVPDGPMNIATDRIELFFARNCITARQHAAAVRLQKDWHMAVIEPVASSFAEPGGGGGHPMLPQDAKVAAMKRHGGAHIAMGRYRNAVTCVVEQNMTIADMAKRICRRKEIAAKMFHDGLTILADHYRLAQ